MDNNEEKQKSLKELWSFPFVAIIGILFSVSSSELVRNNTVLKCVFIAVLLLWAVLFTFAVGIAQGITSYALFRKRGKVNYCIALGFTAFSLCSVGYKTIGHFSLFALTKTIAYVAILVVLLLPGSREVFWRK